MESLRRDGAVGVVRRSARAGNWRVQNVEPVFLPTDLSVVSNPESCLCAGGDLVFRDWRCGKDHHYVLDSVLSNRCARARSGGWISSAANSKLTKSWCGPAG